MKRSTWSGQTVVYRYGCPSWADLDTEGLRQLELARGWRNELVRIERRYEAMSGALWLSIPEVAAAQVAVEAATAAVEGVAASTRGHRVRSRSTVPDPVLKSELTQARADRRAAKEQLAAVKAQTRPVHKALRVELDAAKRCASGGCTKATCTYPTEPHPYACWVQESGMGYATYTDIADKHRVSVARVIALRKAGRPARHRYQDNPHEGTLTVQLKFGERVNRDHWAIDEGRPAKEWLGRDRARHEMSTDARCTFRLRIGRGGGHGPYWLELPVVLHRPVPGDAVVAWARVTRRVVAARASLSVSLTALLPDVADKPDGEVCDVDFRWSSKGPSVGVLVARVSTASGTMSGPPGDIADMVAFGGDYYELVVPGRWRDLLAQLDEIRSARSRSLDELRPSVTSALADSDLAQRVGFGPDAARLMKFAKYHRLAVAWPSEHPLADVVETWRRSDRADWAREAHGRQKVTARRRDAYRKAAAWICDASRVVAVRDVDVADLRRQPPVEDEDTYEARGSRRLIQFAAPSELKAEIVNAAARRGVLVVHRFTEEDQ